MIGEKTEFRRASPIDSMSGEKWSEKAMTNRDSRLAWNSKFSVRWGQFAWYGPLTWWSSNKDLWYSTPRVPNLLFGSGSLVCRWRLHIVDPGSFITPQCHILHCSRTDAIRAMMALLFFITIHICLACSKCYSLESAARANAIIDDCVSQRRSSSIEKPSDERMFWFSFSDGIGRKPMYWCHGSDGWMGP
jgi:hypothetical protein